MPAAHRVPALAAIALFMSPGLVPIRAAESSAESIPTGQVEPAALPQGAAIECVPTCVPRPKEREIGRDIGTAGTIREHDLAILVPRASSTAP